MGNSIDNLAVIEQRLLDAPMSLDRAKLLDADWVPDVPFNDPPVAAAVLLTLINRPEGFTIVFTLRSKGLRAHSGQIAFPGGKLDAGDTGPGAGALREAAEEIDLNPASARILGYMPSYLTGTNYIITPVVAEISGQPEFKPNPREVDQIFEVPLSFVLHKDSFSKLTLTRNTRIYSTWQMNYGAHTIWGITANLLRKFHDMALSGLVF